MFCAVLLFAIYNFLYMAMGNVQNTARLNTTWEVMLENVMVAFTVLLFVCIVLGKQRMLSDGDCVFC